MKKIIKLLKEKVERKLYWLRPSRIKLVTNEARKRKITESALMDTIITNWFEK